MIYCRCLSYITFFCITCLYDTKWIYSIDKYDKHLSAVNLVLVSGFKANTLKVYQDRVIIIDTIVTTDAILGFAFYNELVFKENRSIFLSIDNSKPIKLDTSFYYGNLYVSKKNNNLVLEATSEIFYFK